MVGSDEMSDSEVVVVEDDESAGSKKTDDPPMPLVDTAWLSYLAPCTAPSLLSRPDQQEVHGKGGRRQWMQTSLADFWLHDCFDKQFGLSFFD